MVFSFENATIKKQIGNSIQARFEASHRFTVVNSETISCSIIYWAHMSTHLFFKQNISRIRCHQTNHSFIHSFQTGLVFTHENSALGTGCSIGWVDAHDNWEETASGAEQQNRKKTLRIRYAKTCAWYESSVHGKEINKIITMQVMLVSATDWLDGVLSACRHWSGTAAWWMRNVVIHVALPLCRSTKWGQAKSTWNKPYKYQTDNHHRRMWTRFRAQSHYLFQSLA